MATLRCVWEGCDVEFTPRVRGQVRCERHAGLKGRRLPDVATKRHECLMCGGVYVPTNFNTLYCGKACKAKYEAQEREAARVKRLGGERVCIICKRVKFAPIHPNHVRCTDCSYLYNLGVKNASQQKVIIPCSKCKHGRPNSAADLGFECGLERWTACAPLFHKRLFVSEDA